MLSAGKCYNILYDTRSEFQGRLPRFSQLRVVAKPPAGWGLDMTEVPSFELIFDQLEEARVSLGPDYHGTLIELQQQSEDIIELMVLSRELSEPPPTYFTRGGSPRCGDNL